MLKSPGTWQALALLVWSLGCKEQAPVQRGTTPPGGSSARPPPFEAAGVSGCKPLEREAGTDYGGVRADTYAWYDQACQLRTAGLVPGDSPGGGGFARGFTYEAAGRTRRAFGTGTNGWDGFGYLVNHGEPTVTSKGLGAAQRVVLAGKHHAIHEFKTRMQMGGPVDVTVHWFFATGRSHPVFAITHDATAAGPGKVRSDARSPYGDLAWDEGPGADQNVDGVGWGDRYQFVSKGKGPLTPQSEWDYTAENTVPYAMAWAERADAEMGLVQTQTFDQLPAGGDYGDGVLAAQCWNRTSQTQGSGCSSDAWTMPHDWLWPMQLNQWELPSTTRSHRIAWGSSTGAVGGQYRAFGKALSGYPYYSYSVSVVLGTHSARSVEMQRRDVEAAQRTTVSTTQGTVAAEGPGGVGRADLVRYVPTGFDPVYGVWELAAASGAVSGTITVAGGKLDHPIFRVRGLTPDVPLRVRMEGKEQTSEVDFFASDDRADGSVWITLHATLSGTARFAFETR